MKWLAVILILVVGCGGDDRPRVVDPLLEPIVSDYESDCGCVNQCSVFFADLSSLDTEDIKILGHADSDLGVMISDSLISKAKAGDVEQITVVIYHELTHCALGRWGHDDTEDEHGRPVSIMYSLAPYHFKYIRKHWDEFVLRLFNHDG